MEASRFGRAFGGCDSAVLNRLSEETESRSLREQHFERKDFESENFERAESPTTTASSDLRQVALRRELVHKMIHTVSSAQLSFAEDSRDFTASWPSMPYVACIGPTVPYAMRLAHFK